MQVWQTTVLGLQHLLAATEMEPLTHISCFSSMVALTGNPGQADYGMANAMLNALCQVEYRRRQGACAVKALNWGPWEGGMVRPELQTHFAAMGIPLIPLENGARHFVRELQEQAVVGWDNRSSSFWPRSSDHFDHFGKHQSGIYMPQGPEFICGDNPNPLPWVWDYHHAEHQNSQRTLAP